MLQFPSENSYDHQNVFIMTPVSFIVTTPTFKTTQIRQQRLIHKPESSDSIVLPTPSSGLNLNESGSWDESAGYQHARTKEGLMDLGTKTLAHQAREKSGSLSNIFFKGEFINDYASLSYQGSNFREYTFGWDLIPKTEKEAIEIMNIIKQIRYFSLPNYNSTVIKYPYMWEVNPAIDSKIELILKDCVITRLTVNYTPEGVLKTYKTGHPISVNIDVTFKEIYRASDNDVIGYSGPTKGQR